jgi:hypothetical protein
LFQSPRQGAAQSKWTASTRWRSDDSRLNPHASWQRLEVYNQFDMAIENDESQSPRLGAALASPLRPADHTPTGQVSIPTPWGCVLDDHRQGQADVQAGVSIPTARGSNRNDGPVEPGAIRVLSQSPRLGAVIGTQRNHYEGEEIVTSQSPRLGAVIGTTARWSPERSVSCLNPHDSGQQWQPASARTTRARRSPSLNPHGAGQCPMVLFELLVLQ